MGRLLFAIGVTLAFASHVVAQALTAPASEGVLPPPAATSATPSLVLPSPTELPAPTPVPAATPTGFPTTVLPSVPPYPSTPSGSEIYIPPDAPSPMRITEPPWCASPYKHSAWRAELDLIPTNSDVSDFAFGGWRDNSGLALRLSLGYEGSDGVGTRLQFWGIGQKVSTPVDDVDLDASTFYWDFYKRFYVDDAELVLGGGVAGSHLEYKLDDINIKANYEGGGISVFTEGFYPLWRFKSTDIGSVVRGRISLLSGQWRNHGMPFIDDTDHDVMSIIELGWGLELRHRFGPNDERFCFVDIVPEFQRWESASLPNEVDPSFEGTNISFGLAW